MGELDSTRVFIMQTKISRLMADIRVRVSCRRLFKKFDMFTIVVDYLFSVSSFGVDNVE